jgi:hypothetical protein
MMTGQKELSRSSAEPQGYRPSCGNHHILFNRFRTSGDWFILALHFDEAETAKRIIRIKNSFDPVLLRHRSSNWPSSAALSGLSAFG